ncbi:MAG: hypothetical protein JW863_22010 [Chitinispirillaceae bacterium]|nr:hypothetical protein [Chitinispirillaceae bacterium]
MFSMHFRCGAETVVLAAVISLAGCPLLAGATGLSIPVGMVFEHNFYPQFGLSASVAHDLLLKGHPRLSATVTSSRLSVLAGRNVLKKENVFFSAGWYFRPRRFIDPYAGIDAGFTRFSREDDELFALLPNTAGLFNIRAGITSSLLGGRLRPSVDGSFALITSSTVFPLFFSITVAYDVAKGVLP